MYSYTSALHWVLSESEEKVWCKQCSHQPDCVYSTASPLLLLSLDEGSIEGLKGFIMYKVLSWTGQSVSQSVNNPNNMTTNELW